MIIFIIISSLLINVKKTKISRERKNSTEMVDNRGTQSELYYYCPDCKQVPKICYNPEKMKVEILCQKCNKEKQEMELEPFLAEIEKKKIKEEELNNITTINPIRSFAPLFIIHLYFSFSICSRAIRFSSLIIFPVESSTGIDDGFRENCGNVPASTFFFTAS